MDEDTFHRVDHVRFVCVLGDLVPVQCKDGGTGEFFSVFVCDIDSGGVVGIFTKTY